MTSTSIYTPIKPTYLYIKQHSITGLKYFGKTSKDPYKYPGSGTYWLRHITKYGKQFVKTLWVSDLYYDTSIADIALHFSKENNIVESNNWANLILENGLDGGIPLTEEAKLYLHNIQVKKVIDGTHHLLNGEIQRNASRKRVNDNTHNFLGPESNKKRIENGTHNFLLPGFQSSIQNKRVKNGTHPFQNPKNKEISQNAAKQTRILQLEKGQHNFQIKGLTAVIDKFGNTKRMDVNEYKLQYTDPQKSEWVSCMSTEGKRRKLFRS